MGTERVNDMSTDANQVATLFVFFFGVGLSMWRLPQADRWHRILCGIAAAVWFGLLLFEPRARTPGYGFVIMTLLVISLSARARPDVRRHTSDQLQ